MSENIWVRSLLLPLLLASMLLMTGCGGCRNDEPKTAAEKKKEKEEEKKKRPKENFITGRPVIYPGIFEERREAEDKVDLADLSEEERERERQRIRRNSIRNYTKPGHWVNSHLPLIANNFNASGQLSARATDVTGKPIGLPGTEFYSYTERPATLAKGEWKNLETTLFLPRRDTLYSAANVKYALSGAAGLDQVAYGYPHSLMQPGQFHMVVLANDPASFRYLKALDCIAMPQFNTLGSPMYKRPFYHVVDPKPDQSLPLSRNSLTWTTISVLVWGDYSPEDLDAEQQLALLDWLHFGGQIIMSGPDALEKLRTSFLEPYLPATFESSMNLTDEDFAEFNKNWSLELRQNKDRQRLFRIGNDALVGVNWTKHPEAEYVKGTAEMVVERQLGRGRIVVTRFPLDRKSPITKWQSYPSFFNGCLLRKPRRKFEVDERNGAIFRWDNDGASPYDPLLGSTLRYLSRDLAPLSTDDFQEVIVNANSKPQTGFNGFGSADLPDVTDLSLIENSVRGRNPDDQWHYGGYDHDLQSGVAGWNDFSGISNAARKALKSAAGIDPPSPAFVLRMLGVYLLVLVPVNWLIFRLIGKVEWAWVAAPLIAIAGAFAVVKMASLDIGFVRSQTQLGFLEIHGDYPRGHLTEYSALYTSLSTRYAMQLDNPTALSLPFSAKGKRELSNQVIDRSALRGVRLNRAIDNQLEDYLIQSNFTGMLHTEMIYDANGVLSLSDDASELVNGTAMNLASVGVVHRDDSGNLSCAMIGDLGSGETKSLEFVASVPEELYQNWYATDVFTVSLGDSREIWAKHFAGRQAVSLVELERIELVDGEKIINRLSDSNPRILTERSNRSLIKKEDFEVVFEKLRGEPAARINLGGMLFAIDKTLKLGKGEYRMIAYTQDQLSTNQLKPEATQLQQLTMVLAHLRRPKWADPAPDQDHWVDLIIDSDLEYGIEAENEAKEDLEFGDENEGDENEN